MKELFRNSNVIKSWYKFLEVCARQYQLQEFYLENHKIEFPEGAD